MAEPLDALRLPLRGSHLIEASAGTGKTWTMAALYLRLVLGHGPAGSAPPRPLLPGEILVMTFTRAATRELADRIRARLSEAARCFRGEVPPADPLLEGLLADHPEAEARSVAAWRLAQAADAMDEAAVHTIDAWCQRMLREHAFDSGSLFDETLVADERGLQAEAVRDYWRQAVYPLAPAVLDQVLALWPAVEALEQDMAALLPRLAQAADVPDAVAGADIEWDEPSALGLLLQSTTTRRASRLAELREGWAQRAEDMRLWLDGQCARKPSPFNGTRLRASNYTGWLKALAEWAEAGDDRLPGLTDAARRRLTPAGMEEALSGKAEPDAWPAHFEAFVGLMSALDALPDASSAARWMAARWVARRVAELKRQAGTFGFADLPERLAHALQGPHGERLRGRILAQYPAAMVDEFQDTSPLQYRLFDLIYRVADNDPARVLLLIGDPKQSIYRFRGADIHSYLRARRATEGRHHALGTNHRSTAAMVAAVNQVFLQAEVRGQGGGAFAFADGAGHSVLPFEPVAARGRPECFVTGAGAVPALTVALDGTMGTKDEGLRRMAGHAAAHIVALLNDPQAGFGASGGVFARLRPADMAVLVRNRREAALIRDALRRRGLPTVYLSDQESVFDSQEALDLLGWLRAVAEPRDLRQARRAYACATFDLTLAELQAHADDDAVWDARLADLAELQQVWQRQGVLAMLRQTVHRLGLAGRWLAAPDGDRRLTNVLHLAELLQSASGRVAGEQGLIRWLAHQVQGPQGAEAADERIVRLESDADLVKVVTVHKSKGLEYPVVVMPFAATFRAAAGSDAVFDLAGPDGERRAVLQPTGAELQEAERERLREDLRLMYVALTRARHALWLGLTPLADGNVRSGRCALYRSALGHLLGAGPDTQPDDIPALLARWEGAVPGEVVVRPAQGDADVAGWRPPAVPEALRPVPVYEADFERDWAIGSFSALVRDMGTATSPGRLPLSARQEALMAEPDAPRGAVGRALPTAPQPWHRFPRGALPGNFLHEQMEWLAQEGFALGADPAVADALRRRCERQGWGHLADDVIAWLGQVVATPLPPLQAPLQAMDQLVPEMEFWLPSEGLAAQAVDGICRRHLWPGRARPPLPQRRLKGMLMGFADLVVSHGGRYWVLDYKSSLLGAADGDYHRDALLDAVLQHRYEVQAQIYLQALHRLLRARLGGGYDPARHLGGAVFVFLRGIAGPERGCCVVPAVPAALQALDHALDARPGEEGAWT